MVAAIASPAWQTSGAFKYVTVAPKITLVAAVLTPRTTRPLTSDQAFALMGGRVAATVDGAMFDTCGGPRLRGEGNAAYYRRVGCARPNWRALDRARGIDMPSTRPGDGMTISIMPDGSLHAAGGDGVTAGADVAFQLYPPLVRNGRVVSGINGGPNAETNWRAGVGYTATGQIILGIGRMSMDGMAAAMLRAGAIEAGYSDGGGSGRVVTADGRREGSTENRPVAMWIASVPGGVPVGAVAVPPPPAGAVAPTDPTPNVPDAPEEPQAPAGGLSIGKVIFGGAVAAAGAVVVATATGWRP